MRNQKMLSVLLAAAMMTSIAAGCSSKNQGAAAPATATTTPAATTVQEEKKPVLKILMGYSSAMQDPNTDKSALKIKEKTGWNVQYFMLPQQNPDEKLMMEIAAGNEYDALKLKPSQFATLAGQNQLQELGPLLDKFAPNIKKSNSELAWKASMSNGKIVGIPYESAGDVKQPYGLIQSGFAVRTDFVNELNLKLPTDLDSFTDFLKKIKAAKNIEPLTGMNGNNPFLSPISSAFGVGGTEWNVVNGAMVHRTKLSGYLEFIKYIRQLYSEGLMDKEWPVNKQENINQKISNGKAALMFGYFYDLPTLLPAIQKTSPNAQIDFIANLNGKDGKPYIAMSKGINNDIGYTAVPRVSKNAEYVVKYFEKLSEPEIFLATYLGDKGVHFEVKDGKYYPVLPAFNDLNNSKQFTGYADPVYSFQLWQARARKTPEMAVAYEKLNANIEKQKEFMHVDVSGYAAGLEAVQKYKSVLTKMENDFIVKMMASSEPVDKLYDTFLKDWEKQGGTELTKALNDWYAQNKSAIK